MTPEQATTAVELLENMWLAVLVLGVLGALALGLFVARAVRP